MKYLLAIALSAFCVAGTADELDLTTDLPEATVLLSEDADTTEAPVASDEESTEETVVALADDEEKPSLLIAMNDQLDEDMDIDCEDGQCSDLYV